MNGSCAWCARPTPGAVLCDRCGKTFDVAVANIAAYTADLDTIRTRQARYGDPAPVRRGGGPVPLPVDDRFTDAWPDTDSAAGSGSMLEADVRNTVTGWVRICLDEWSPLTEVLVCTDPLCHRCQPLAAEAAHRRPPRDTIASCCAYLQRQRPRICGMDWAPQALDELLHLERRLRRFVDRPADRWYAGPCTVGLHGIEAAWFCGAELYASPGRLDVTCPDCGWVYSVEERRAWLLAAAEDRWETAAAIARAVVVWTDYDRGESRLVRRISDWAARRRITVRDQVLVDGRRRPVYRLGDVLDLLADEARDSEVRGA